MNVEGSGMGESKWTISMLSKSQKGVLSTRNGFIRRGQDF